MERLQSARLDYKRRLAEIESREAETLEARRESEALLVDLREKRKRRWEEELREARVFVREVRDRGRRLLAEIEGGLANRRALDEFTKVQTAAIADRAPAEVRPSPESAGQPVPGDEIQVADTGIRGELLSVQGERAWIQRGSMRFEVPAKEIRAVGKPGGKQPRAGSVAVVSGPVPTADREINLIGRRTREAVGELEGFLDRAVCSGQSSVRIIHGVGSGALRRAVADYLATSPYCSSFRAGESAEGGSGVTIAVLETA